MNLNEVPNPGPTPADTWAAHREFDLRWRAYRRHRLGGVAASMRGVTDAFKRMTVVLAGER